MTTYGSEGTEKVTFLRGKDGVTRIVKRKKVPVISEDDPRFTGWLGPPTRKNKVGEKEVIGGLITIVDSEPRAPRESRACCDIL